MEKFDNYVFMTICETSSVLFEKSRFSTYGNYCNTLYLSLLSGNLDKKETNDVIQISNDLVLIYGFDDKTCCDYILKYFELSSDVKINFYKAVKLTLRCFPLSFN